MTAEKNLYAFQAYVFDILLSAINFLIFFLIDFIYLYKLLCNTRVMLKWFPTLDFQSKMYCFISYITDPYFNFWKALFKPIKLSNLQMNPLPLIYINFINYFFYFLVYLLKIIYKRGLIAKNLYVKN